MEVHNNGNRPQAERRKVDLSKKVTRETPSAQRSLKTNAQIFGKDVKAAANKTIGVAGKAVGGVGSTVASSTDNSMAGGAAIAQGVKTAQALASATVVGGKAIKTAAKASIKTVKVVAKVPKTVKSYFKLKPSQKRYIKRLKRLSKRKYRAKRIAANAKKAVGAVGGISRAGSGISQKASSALENSLRSGDGAGTAAAGLAMQSSRAIRTGVRVGGKAVKTGAKVTMRTVKTTRKLATKVGRKIATGTAKRAMKTSAKAAEQATKTTKKAAEVSAKASVKLVKALVMVVSKAVSLIMSTAPWSLILIGGMALIMCGGFLLGGGVGASSGSAKKVGLDMIANSSYSDEYVENLTDEQAESVFKSKINSFSVDVKKSVDKIIIAPLKEKVEDYLQINDSNDSNVSKDSSVENVNMPAKNRKIVEINLCGTKTVLFPAEDKNDEIGKKINDIVFDNSDFLAALFTLKARKSSVHIDELSDIRFDFAASAVEEFLGDIDSNSCEYGPTYLYKKIEEQSGCSCPDQNCDSKDGIPYCPGEHTKLTIEICPVTAHELKPIFMIYGFSDDETELYNTAIVLLGGD